ncbi:MAG TPA: TIGR02466 family protein, partial [Pseudobdellovibrionaceae bacterium]|nr:TIGR02466 family protein [Pseudobdellovibrionaceae bacterium]
TFDDLRKLLDRHVASFTKSLELDIPPKELQMTSCWVNIMPEAVVHTMHIHPLSVISGTYYVETPAGSGAL